MNGYYYFCEIYQDIFMGVIIHNFKCNLGLDAKSKKKKHITSDYVKVCLY